MISRAHRFHGYNALKFVYAHGQTVRGQLLATKYALNPRRRTYRAAVVVGRKTHKSAVVRARIRRRLYEIIRLESVRITQPYDIVILVFSDKVATIEAGKLRTTVVEQLERAGIILPAARSTGGGHAIVDTKESSA
jgi:ribonuclease P protein component